MPWGCDHAKDRPVCRARDKLQGALYIAADPGSGKTRLVVPAVAKFLREKLLYMTSSTIFVRGMHATMLSCFSMAADIKRRAPYRQAQIVIVT